VNQRLVINYYTAKRMLAALSMSVQRHELNGHGVKNAVSCPSR